MTDFIDASPQPAKGSRKLLRACVGSFHYLSSVMNKIGTLWIFGFMLLIVADICARTIFNSPIKGVGLIVGYSIVGCSFLQFSNALHVGRFTRVEALIGWLLKTNPLTGNSLLAFFSLCGAGMFVAIGYGSYGTLSYAWNTNEIVGVPGDFTFDIWPIKLIIVIGAAVTAIEFLIQAYRQYALAYRAASEKGQNIVRDWLATAFVFGLIFILSQTVNSDMSSTEIGIVTVVGLLALVYAGMHVGIVLMLLGLVGIWMIKGSAELSIDVLELASGEYLANYLFAAVPLFVLMGMLVSVSGVGKETFEIAHWALRRVKGGLGIATVLASAIFASITGSSIASASVFTRISVPEMIKHGYTPRFAVGIVAGSSVLGMLIPPSLLLIVYAFLAEQSVGILFLAAIVPGLILAGAFSIGILFIATFFPHVMGNPDQDNSVHETLASSVKKLVPIFLLIILVLGGIYGGLFTPTEAGAAGAAGALIIAMARGRLGWQKLWQVLHETGHITVSILFLILAANVFARMLALSGLPQEMVEVITSADLGLYGFMALYVLVLIVLGMVLDSVSIMLIVLPFVLPVIVTFGADLVWFGIITVIAVEIGLLTPPLGLTVYVVKSTLKDVPVTLNEIFLGAFPFVVIMLIVTAILILVPQLSLVFV